MSEDSSLDSWFLHEKLALKLLSENEAAELASQIPDPSQPFAQSRRIDLLERAIASYLQRGDVESLHVEHLRGRIAPGRLIWLEQAFYFKGLSAALDRIKRRGDGAATFYGMLATNESVRVNGSYNAARITCSTAFGKLSGRQRQFILGYIEDVSGSAIAVRPIVIAQRWLRPSTHIPNFHPSDPCHVWPGDVDQFAEVDFKTRLDMSDLRLLKDLPEALIKEYFADILGEPSVPKDWGGEQFDLWTNDRLSIEGKQLRAAIAFKGPAKFAPMTIATLGKNGDQIDRLAQTAADVLVVQHCHQITAPVINMLKAYASDYRNPRRYMTIDGFNTIRILRHFGKL